MNVFTVTVIGAAVAQDAFAAAALFGALDKTKKLRFAFYVCSCFALFQMIMPLLGWSIGKVGSTAVDSFDHIIAFIILSFIGIKMMIDSKKPLGDDIILPGFRSVIFISLATSIDALTTGITLPAATNAKSTAEIITAVLLIGFITFIVSFTGYLLGMKLSRFDSSAARIAGGAVLCAIGIKTLLAG